MMRFKGQFEAWGYSPGGVLLWKEKIANAVTDTALNAILDGYFNGGTVTASWYLGLVDNSGFSALAAADTMSSHSGWTEFTSYTSATRPAWGHASASGKIVQNATLTTFTINATGTLKGLFLTSNSTKGGTTGVLWATGAFSATRDVITGMTVPLRYRVIAAAG